MRFIREFFLLKPRTTFEYDFPQKNNTGDFIISYLLNKQFILIYWKSEYVCSFLMGLRHSLNIWILILYLFYRFQLMSLSVLLVLAFVYGDFSFKNLKFWYNQVYQCFISCTFYVLFRKSFPPLISYRNYPIFLINIFLKYTFHIWVFNSLRVYFCVCVKSRWNYIYIYEYIYIYIKYIIWFFKNFIF